MLVGQTIAEIWRFFHFFKLGPSAILDLLCARLNHPQRVFDDIYHCAKFGWNRCSSFDNMQVLIFNQFVLKMPIHAPHGWFLGGFCPLNVEQSYREPQKRPPCTEARNTTYRSLRSVHQFLHSSPFYPIPWNPMLCNGPDTPPKSAPSRWGMCNTSNMVRWVHRTQHPTRHLDRPSCFPGLPTERP